jgi:outer membrane murein-binding lipoprotein Lpp
MSPGRRPPAALLALAFAVASAAPARAEDAPASPPTLYKWVDTNGIAHYTTDPEQIPAELRGLARELREREGARAVQPPSGAPGAADSTADAWAARDAGPPPVGAQEGGTTAGGSSDASLRTDAGDLDARIAALEEEIARDEERIKAWVSDPALDPVTLADDPGFRELAARLPRLHEDLRSLREQKQGAREP